MLEVSLAMLLLSVFAGICIGTLAGLLPGVHVNNTSAILLGISPTLLAAGAEPLYVAVTIVASTVTQSFLDIIPTVFVGAPDEATVLAVMPGHRMLLDGLGLEAVRLSAMGSGLAIVISLLLIYPLSLFFRAALPVMQANMALILIVISAFVILSNYRGSRYAARSNLKNVWWALLIFLVAGLLGLAAFGAEGSLSPMIALGAPSVLLPLLSGLFGLPALLMSLNAETSIPRQVRSKITLPRLDIIRSAAAGTIAGTLVSWFPAVSAGVATSIVGILSKKDDSSDRRYLIAVSGVNTANAVFSLVALYVILRPRSGAVAAAQEVLGGSIGYEAFVLFLLSICVTAIFSYLLTMAAGYWAASAFSALDYGRLSTGIIAFLVILCLAMTGFPGLAIFTVATAVGLAAHLINVRKTCLMGVLLVPCILYFL